MRKIHFAIVGAAALALAACGSGEEDQLVDNAGERLEADELNALADNAAAEAQAEMEALEAQQQQLAAEPATTAPATEPAEELPTEHSEVEDEPLGL